MDLGLRDTVVFITGASGGIGRAVARLFAEEGAKLALHFHRGEIPHELLELEDRVLAVQADVTDPEQIEGAMRAAVERFGRVDVCVANAGAWPSEGLLLHEMPVERARRTVEVNLLGALWTARAFMGALARTGPRDDAQGAALIFTGSTAGRFGEKGHVDYSGAKAGLYGLVRTLKNEIVEIDPFARVNMVEPGWTVTEMARAALEVPGTIQGVVRTMPVRQLGRAVDIARCIAWLASPTVARHITGEVITVAGGMEGRVQWDSEQIDEQAIKERLKSKG